MLVISVSLTTAVTVKLGVDWSLLLASPPTLLALLLLPNKLGVAICPVLDGGVPASGGVGTLPPPSNDVEEIAEIDAAVAAIDAAILIPDAIPNVKSGTDKIAIADKDAVSRIKTLMLEEQDAIKKLEIQKTLIEEERKQAVLGKDLTEQQIKEINTKAVEDTKAVSVQITAIEADKNAKILASAQLVRDTKLSNLTFELERFKGDKDEEIRLNNEFLAQQLTALEAQRLAELAALDLSEAEKEAIREKYRFYSYGDAMLIL